MNGSLAVLVCLALTAGFIPQTFAVSRIPLATEPGGLEAVAVAPGTIEVFWMPGERGRMITILRDGQEVARVDVSDGRWRDTGLAPETIYTYIVSGATVAEKSYPVFPAEAEYDIVVVGGTASGVAAAVAAARLGSRVALLEETNRLGGMASNGLGSTDIRNKAASNGFFEDFRLRVAAYYGTTDGFRYEPRVANAVIKSLIYEHPNITVFRRTRAVAPVFACSSPSSRHGRTDDAVRRVVGVRALHLPTEEEGILRAGYVIDATIEGDFAAACGAVCRIGREARSPREPHAGVIYYDNKTQEILPGSTGEGDHRIQSYAYLMTLKDYGPAADRRIPMPPDYDPEEFRPSPPWEKSWAFTSGRLPNNKFEVNQHPFGTDLPEVNYTYLEEDTFGRMGIEELYRRRALQYLYYLQTELGHRNLGLADDEYRAEGGWPPTLYVRTGRRVEGLVMLDEMDITTAPENRRRDSVAIGDYPMDSHAVRKVTDPNARHRGEGEWWLAAQTPWYRVPLGILIPRGVKGLLVTSAVSATYVAYGTLRMEPVRMSLGQAGGIAAHMALLYRREPQDVPLPLIQDKLLDQNAYLTLFTDVNRNTRHFKAIQWLGTLGFFGGEEFRPDEPLTRTEASVLMQKLIAAENHSGRSASSHAQPAGNLSEAEGSLPITRAEFAELLVRAKRISSADWEPQAPTVRHYRDLQPGSDVELYAETLYRHHIRASSWQPLNSQDQSDLFRPDDSITRADAALAVFLAHRPVLMSIR